MPAKQKLNQYERKITPVEHFFTRSPFSVVTMVARIKGQVSEELLRNAVVKVQQRHVLLRVRIKDDPNHNQWFTSEGVQEIPIEVIPRKSEKDWIEVHQADLKVPFEFETRPAIRFILVQSPDLSELIISCHHIICDGLSLAYLVRDLMQHMGDPAREAEVLPAPPTINLNNLPNDVRQSGIAEYFIKRMNRQWAEESVFFDQEDYKTLTRAYWNNYNHEILTIELSKAETSALVKRCKKENVTVNSALSAAFSGAQSVVDGEKPHHAKIVVAASVRDRIPKPAGEGTGMYAGSVELKFKYNHKKSFWDNARNFHKKFQPKFTDKILFENIINWLYLDPTIFESMNFKKLGGLVPSGEPRHEKLVAFSKKDDVVLGILKRSKLESLETMVWGTAVTNLGRLDFPNQYGALELDRLIMQPGGGIPLVHASLVLGAVTCSGKLSLVLEYSDKNWEAGALKDVKDQALAFLLD